MKKPMQIKVALVEDDAPVREALAGLIRRSPGFLCVGAYADGETALAEIPRQKPDVVLMDIKLPGISGIECIRALRVTYPAVHIVMLTVYDEVGQLLESLLAGASGYLLKRTPADKLLEAIEEASLGGAPMTRKIARKVVQYFHQLGETKAKAPAATDFTTTAATTCPTGSSMAWMTGFISTRRCWARATTPVQPATGSPLTCRT
jgi:DNA-binding NarL/FixJ family response regulator